nr:Gfo/Idh/MocA family oxidoreductase [Clostridia bacterium]
MKNKVNILLVGVGGYGATYLDSLLDNKDDRYVLCGMVEPFPKGAARIGEALDAGVPLYNTMAEFYAKHTADLAVISTPIHLHTPMIKEALANGSHVLCEKPLCGDDRDIEALTEARDKAGLPVSIGYQLSHSEAVLELKKDIISGVFGAPKLLKTLVLWPRTHEYYGRGIGWAGRMRAKDGTLIRDSVANNATAHYLFNMFYILGDKIDSALMPDTIETKAWHANDIDSFDTAEIYCTFKNGARAVYLGTHATDIHRGPDAEYIFEKGTVYFGIRDGIRQLWAKMNDGSEKVYGNPFANSDRKLYMAADNVLNGTSTVCCGIEAAAVQTRIIAAVHEQHPEIPKFEDSLIEQKQINGKDITVCRGLAERLTQIYENL